MIFRIMKKELLQNFRDKQAMFWMIVFPIIMIFILGNSLSAFFGQEDLSVPKTKVVYNIKEDTKETKNLEKFFIDSKESLNMEFVKNDDKDKIISDIKLGKYDCYLEIKSDKDIAVYSNDIKNFNASLITNLIETYVEKTNAIESIKDKNPIGLRFVDTDSSVNFVKTKSLDSVKQPTSLDYYSVTMLTMTILYSTLTGAMAVTGERVRGTMKRISCSPVSKFSVYTGKMIACCIVVGIQVSLLFLFTKYMFDANWGSDLTSIMLILVSLIIFTVSLGMGFARMFKNPNLMSTIIHMLIVLMNFLGGGYVRLDMFGKNNILTVIAKISPIKWTNESIFNIIYGNDYSLVMTAVVINLSLAVILMIVPSIFSKKGEV